MCERSAQVAALLAIRHRLVSLRDEERDDPTYEGSLVGAFEELIRQVDGLTDANYARWQIQRSSG